jgi:hypothetical protein
MFFLVGPTPALRAQYFVSSTTLSSSNFCIRLRERELETTPSFRRFLARTLIG